MSSPLLRRAELLDGEALTVLVGEDKKAFFVHRKLICEFSSFFRAACNGPWKESEEGIVTLPEDGPEEFGIYLKWLYTNELIDKNASTENDAHGNPYQIGRPNTLARAYVIGDKIQDILFKNAAIGALIQQISTTKSYPTGLAQYVYENTPEKSPLRRLLVDFYAYGSTSKWYEKSDPERDINAAPIDFFTDLVPKIVEVRGNSGDINKEGWPWIKNPSQYQEIPEKENNQTPRSN
ncbi:Btb poz domain containing protein [Neofusicoccum parvum]|nr:Btb poz domain containing protein [Neofusicoccum parvum]